MERQKVIDLLKDCGCDDESINEITQKLNEGKKKEALNLIDMQRKNLLNQFHRCNNCIGCIDYLASQLEKAEGIL